MGDPVIRDVQSEMRDGFKTFTRVQVAAVLERYEAAMARAEAAEAERDALKARVESDEASIQLVVDMLGAELGHDMTRDERRKMNERAYEILANGEGESALRRGWGRAEEAEAQVKELEAWKATEIEVRNAEQSSRANLLRYVADKSDYCLPMSGSDIALRDVIRDFRNACDRNHEALKKYGCINTACLDRSSGIVSANTVEQQRNNVRLATCEWREDLDEGGYYTSCGERFEFTTGRPSDNKARFCIYCGGRIIEVKSEPEEENDDAE